MSISRIGCSLRAVVVSALLAMSALGAGQVLAIEVGPTSQALSQALAPTWIPNGPANGSMTYRVNGTVGGWQIEATFAWQAVRGRPAWRLVESTMQYGLQRSSSGGPVVLTGDGAPSVPDPNPPTAPPDAGGVAIHSFWSNGWTYTVTYIWGVRNGVLGWHIESVTIKYTPKPPKMIIE